MQIIVAVLLYTLGPVVSRVSFYRLSFGKKEVHDEESRYRNKMDDTIPFEPADASRIRVIVVGAGLGGLACAMAMHHQGFEVLIFEKVRQFLRLGDSLGLGENALKLLERWGLHDELIAIGNKSRDMNIRRWNDGKILATQPLMVGSSRTMARDDEN